MTTYTPEQIAQAVADNAKSGKWLSQTFHIQQGENLAAVGVKSFGRWVQRVEFCGMVDGVPEQKTLKALKTQTADLINRMLASC